MLTVNKKNNIIFYSIISVGIALLSLFVFFNQLLYSRVSLAVAALGNKLEALCGCTNHWAFSSHPWLFTSLGLAVILTLTFAGFALHKIIRLKTRTRRFVKSQLLKQKLFLSKKLKTVAGELNLTDKIIEIKDNNPVAFCFGFFSPKICISSAFIEQLNSRELKAVLLHEQHHLHHYETIKLFVVKTILAIFFFVPGLRLLSKQYFTLSEISADEWAINNSHDKAPLARAMYKIMELNERMQIANNLAVASFSYVTEERINRIADDSYVVRFRGPQSKLLLKTLAFIVVLVVFFLTIYSTKAAIINNGEESCTMTQEAMAPDCEMLNNGSTCKMHQQADLLNNVNCQETNYNGFPQKFIGYN